MLAIDVEKNGDVAVVRLNGRLVRGEEVRILRSAVVAEKCSRIVVLDLSDVESLDAGGLTTLLGLHHWSKSHGVQLKLVNPSRFVHEIFARTRLDQVFDISQLDHALYVLSGVDREHMRYAATC